MHWYTVLVFIFLAYFTLYNGLKLWKILKEMRVQIILAVS